MGTVLNHSDSVVKTVLKNLCCSYGWSYGAFWSYGHPNSILLTLQDAYFDEKIGSLIDTLPLQVPLGGGIIGQAAYTSIHKWMFSQDNYPKQNFSGSIWDMFLDDHEFRRQFSCGMETIAVIPVESQGVVQFGSNEKIPEHMEFVNQTKRMFQDIENNGGSDIGLTSFNGEICHQNGSNSTSAVLDELPNFGIPNEFFQTGDFSDCNWFPPLKDDIFSFNCNGKRESLTISGTDVDLFGNSGDLGDILAPIIDGSQSRFHSYSSECMPMTKSTQHVDCTALGPKENLFSKLGIEELLEGVSGISYAASSSCTNGQVSAKRRKSENTKWEPKSQPGLNMVNGYSMSGSSTVLQAKKQVESQKPTKKKAKPGTRPRPKDRQQILDRMAELRLLIPNGEKMSIDCLLDRTIKHMVFLQGVTKLADKIKKGDERRQNGVIPSDSSTNGVTWACELGNQMMACPLMVEDLGDPGQMLIEMLCEDHVIYLEIVDIIRGFGLTVLKGVMDARDDKIWAHFIVEPEVNKKVTRHEIFSALVQFLQTPPPLKVDKRFMISENSLLDNFHQSEIQNLVNLTDMQYCVNL